MKSLEQPTLRDAIVPLAGDERDLDALLASIGDVPYVLIGEATHGTHEFYATRAAITRRLIAEKGFNAVCIEGDWPDAYRVNRYVRGAGDDPTAIESLGGFRRFPTWMWRNLDVVAFIGWLRDFNDRTPSHRPKTGFYGLDLYSLYASIDAVIGYLEKIDPNAAARARKRYECLEQFEEHPEDYGRALLYGLQNSCRDEVLGQLLEIQRHAAGYAKLDGRVAEDQYFYAEQNARVVADAENYYRAMLDDSISTWNLRDAHMIDTLKRLEAHLGAREEKFKAVVWAHNSHVGDANATSMSARGETNIGALARELYGRDCFLIGFTTYTGTVTAASEWHAREERKNVRPARTDSYEHRFHELGVREFFLPLRECDGELEGLPEVARERAIGVIYRPESELYSHYFPARLGAQFDAIFHFDRTRAVEPLERSELWERGEIPETFPSGM